MTAYAWDVEANTVKEILAADSHRDEYTIQLQAQEFDGETSVYIKFGEVSDEDAESIRLGGLGDTVRVLGSKARLAVSAIAPGPASGGIETHTTLEYRHTLSEPPWWSWVNPKQ